MIVDVEGLAKRYGHTDALVDLTLQVEPGEVFGFLGPNGAGKTTAVKLLAGHGPTDRRSRHGPGFAPRRSHGPDPDRLPARALPLPAVAAGARGPRPPRPTDRGRRARR